ncbi:hypothetical protein HNQ76_001811 [Thermosulfuriphilus ammonigenes]|nr:hypothetical protein [Thermosulfuriphilus ammonigenes]
MGKKEFIINYFKKSPWYLWVIRLAIAIIFFYYLIYPRLR